MWASLMNESGASRPRVAECTAPVHSCSRWLGGRRVEGGGDSGTKHPSMSSMPAARLKRQSPHGRDVTQQQLTVTTHRPGDGDARLSSSVPFLFCKYEQMYTLELKTRQTQQGWALPSCHTDLLCFTLLLKIFFFPVFCLSFLSTTNNLPKNHQLSNSKSPSSFFVCKSLPFEKLDQEGSPQGEVECYFRPVLP